MTYEKYRELISKEYLLFPYTPNSVIAPSEFIKLVAIEMFKNYFIHKTISQEIAYETFKQLDFLVQYGETGFTKV